MTSIFGPLISNATVEAAVLSTLDLWLPDYMSEVERTQGLACNTLERVRSQQSSSDFENWTEGQLPALVVVCPGTTGELERHDAGIVAAWFEVQVGVLVEDTTEANARRVTQLHQAAIDGILEQKGGLGNLAVQTVLVSRQTRLPDVTNRTLAYAESTFHVLVDGVLDRSQGPLGPSSDPCTAPGPWPTITSIDIPFSSEDLSGTVSPPSGAHVHEHDVTVDE